MLASAIGEVLSVRELLLPPGRSRHVVALLSENLFAGGLAAGAASAGLAP